MKLAQHKKHRLSVSPRMKLLDRGLRLGRQSSAEEGSPMSRCVRPLLAFCICLLVAVCQLPAWGQDDGPTYEGKTVGQWVVQLKHRDPDARVEAARSLGKIGPGARAAVPALAEALDDTELEVRIRACEALGFIGP